MTRERVVDLICLFARVSRRRRRPIRKMIDSEKRASPSLPPSVLITAVLAVCVSVIIPFAALFNYPIPAPARPSLPREHLNRGKAFGVAVGHSERVDQPLAFLLLTHAFTIFTGRCKAGRSRTHLVTR